MARTRTQIKAFVNYNTGRGTEKATLIELLCDEALKVALEQHPFKDARSNDSDTVITEDATSVDISAITDLKDIITATLVETSGDQNAPLILKNETWWHNNIINASDNLKGWPEYGMRRGTSILLDRPADSNLTLRLVCTTEQTFSSDSSECPIAIADLFVTQYVTAMVFLSINEHEKYMRWYTQAMGSQYLINGKIGGTLANIIDRDKRDIAEVSKSERAPVAQRTGISVQNLIEGHDDYGNTRTWR